MKSFKILLHKSSTLFLLCLLPFFSIPTFASNGHFYLGGSAGASRLTLGDNNAKINYYNGLLTDAYPTHSDKSTVPVLGLQGGYEFTPSCSNTAFALGLGVYTDPTKYHFGGTVVETPLNDPASALYNYTFHTQSTRLMAEAQMAWRVNDIVPFINVGLGEAWIKTNGYSEASFDNIGYPPLPPFHSRTNTNFAFQAGLGLGYEFNFSKCTSTFQHERISLGYRYVNLGNTSFGSRGTVYPHKLNLGNLINNDIYVVYTHLF